MKPLVPKAETTALKRSQRYGKRAFDLIIAVPATICFLPIMALIAVLIRLFIGAPVLFRQERPGLHGQPFTMFKFRTMTDEMDARGRLLPDGDRLTPLGRFLRRTSLDELPELFNILRGDLSLVGPRPLLMQYLPYFTARERLRHTVRPGLTGWAQVNGRNYLSWDRRLALDVWYVENWSIMLDIRILVRTFLVVFKSEGVAVDSDTVESYLDQERGR